jgi:hypothetical protein
MGKYAMNKRHIRNWLLACALLVGFVFSSVDRATALTRSSPPAAIAGEAVHSSPLVVPAAGFASDGSSPDTMFFSFYGGNISGNSCWQAPVNLPPGANIKYIYASLYDNDITGNTWLDFYRVDNYSGVSNLLAGIVTTTDYDGIQILYAPISEIYNEVSYPQFSYYLGSCGDSALTRLYSVRVYFTMEFVLPIVVKN